MINKVDIQNYCGGTPETALGKAQFDAVAQAPEVAVEAPPPPPPPHANRLEINMKQEKNLSSRFMTKIP